MARIGGRLAVTLVTILAAGCAASRPTAAPGPEPSRPTSPASSAVPSAHVTALADTYMGIAVPANHSLDVEVDGYTDEEHSDLGTAEADLRAEAATIRVFDQHLGQIRFPPGMAATARALIRVNQLRATLIDQQARSSSITELESFDRQHHALDASVEIPVKILRRDLRLPPPSDS
jgi:hypothetical protein